jgi:hypothetical protein
VITWFAARADMILLLFDAHKLDISDEFKDAIQGLKVRTEKQMDKLTGISDRE